MVGAGLTAAALIEPRRLRSRHHQASLHRLAPEFDGFTIAHLSDLHAGAPGAPRGMLERAIDLVLESRPEIVVITGDFVDRGTWVDDLRHLSRLADILPTYGVLGNHDAHPDGKRSNELTERLIGHGIQLLRNTGTSVRSSVGESGAIHVFGVEHGHGADLRATLEAVGDRTGPRVLLAHSPEILWESTIGEFDLVLSGHTHGGQVRLSPWRHQTALDVGMTLGGMRAPIVRGTGHHAGVPVVVSNGIGVTRFPVRLFAPPQVHFITLRRAFDGTNSIE